MAIKVGADNWESLIGNLLIFDNARLTFAPAREGKEGKDETGCTLYIEDPLRDEALNYTDAEQTERAAKRKATTHYACAIDQMAQNWPAMVNAERTEEDTLILPQVVLNEVTAAETALISVHPDTPVEEDDQASDNVAGNVQPPTTQSAPNSNIYHATSTFNYVGLPAESNYERPALMAFDKKLAPFLSRVLRVAPHTMSVLIDQLPSKWPAKLLNRLASRQAFLDEALLIRKLEAYRMLVKRSVIPGAGKGLFVEGVREQHETVFYIQGILRYVHTEAEAPVWDGNNCNRYGIPELNISEDDMVRNAYTVVDLSETRGVRGDDRGDYIISAGPYRWCPSRFINDCRVLGRSGLMTRRMHKGKDGKELRHNVYIETVSDQVYDDLGRNDLMAVKASHRIEDKELYFYYGDLHIPDRLRHSSDGNSSSSTEELNAS